MRKIDIPINQARILSFSVDLLDDFPQMSVTIGLYSGEKEITTYTLNSRQYFSNKFEIPAEMITPIKKIAEQLETILILECQKSLRQLPEKI